MTILVTLFAAGVLTILLPCILPLVPVVVGASVSGRRRARPLVTVAGMIVSFVSITFLLQIALRRLTHAADVVHVATYYALFLLGAALLMDGRRARLALAAAGAIVFFRAEGWPSIVLAALAGVAAVLVGGNIGARLQQLGAGAQRGAQAEFGRESLVSALVVGLTLGLVWAPCAGPALGFALALVRDEPGTRAAAALTAYAAGAALPLLLVGYGGQAFMRSARRLGRASGHIERASGAVLVLSALAFSLQLFTAAQTWLADRTGFGSLGSALEQQLFTGRTAAPSSPAPAANAALPALPRLGQAPELVGLGPWYNSPPLSKAALRGKVVLVDFWTYSCVNCVRTLPHVQQLWLRYKDQPFVVVGVHAPEFAFEQRPANVADAVKRRGLTYPVAQDNDLATWSAFHNRYWPAKYLIDAQGEIRYTHFGEGGYDATDLAVRSLLAEQGHTTHAGGEPQAPRARQTATSPETYLGSRGWPAFANGGGAPDARPHHYVVPARLETSHFALGGEWQLVDDERQVLRAATGEIHYRALAGEVNLVLGTERGAPPAVAEISVDGRPRGRITIDHHDLYNLFTGPYGEHAIVVRLRGRGAAAYAFTFGG